LGDPQREANLATRVKNLGSVKNIDTADRARQQAIFLTDPGFLMTPVS